MGNCRPESFCTLVAATDLEPDRSLVKSSRPAGPRSTETEADKKHEELALNHKIVVGLDRSGHTGQPCLTEGASYSVVAVVVGLNVQANKCKGEEA